MRFVRAALVLVALCVASIQAAAAPSCPASSWRVPGVTTSPPPDQIIAKAASSAVVLLGEEHPEVDHHRWQLAMLAGLHGRKSNLVIGLEMVPRAAQPVLDRWVAGELGSAAMLKELRWSEVWGFDAELYLPIFEFARLYRLPMVALNVDQSLIARVGREGWAGVPTDAREGIGNPIPAAKDYRRALAAVPGHGTSSDTGKPDDEAIAKRLADPIFQNFVDAQLTWDRAMAEALAKARTREDQPLVVGLVGLGHAEHRWGIPAQLADLNVGPVTVLLPLDGNEGCAELSADLADAVFLVPASKEPASPRARLGVQVERSSSGLKVTSVAPRSIASAARLQAADILVEAAGVPLRVPSDLTAVVMRQSPGTWLPLAIVRKGKSQIVIARFPPADRKP